MNGPRAISLFSGCGGSDLGLIQAGFEVVWANDIWELATKTYADNVKGAEVELGDIADFKRFPGAQLLVGCYPCQGFSQGGCRDAGRTVNYLYREFDRVLRKVLPRAFIVENVNGMRYGPNEELLLNQLQRYRSAGYRVRWGVLDAKDYGTPQSRRRLFIVGLRSDLKKSYAFPHPTHGPLGSRPFVTQRDAIGRMDPWPLGEFCDEPMTWYYLSRNRRRDWDEPSLCIVSHWRNVPLHPSSPPLRRLGADRWRFSSKGRARRLSYRECAILQGFPSQFRWRHGRTRTRHELVGNAVPPPLFKAVAGSIPDIWS